MCKAAHGRKLTDAMCDVLWMKGTCKGTYDDSSALWCGRVSVSHPFDGGNRTSKQINPRHALHRVPERPKQVPLRRSTVTQPRRPQFRVELVHDSEELLASGSWLLALGSRVNRAARAIAHQSHSHNPEDRQTSAGPAVDQSGVYGVWFYFQLQLRHDPSNRLCRNNRKSPFSCSPYCTHERCTHAFMPNDVLDLAKRIESARKLKQNWFFFRPNGFVAFPSALARHPPVQNGRPIRGSDALSLQFFVVFLRLSRPMTQRHWLQPRIVTDDGDMLRSLTTY
ncbi:hypothetical protein EDB80DRAFT_776150 [Ilyonectria destructans]|nr:hypothetical protein EDB80DRAFT_776150 [Ilyonectria destructans]